MTPLTTRRHFLKSLAAVSLLSSSGKLCAADEKPSKKTFTYKVVDGCDIKADVHGVSDGPPRPVVIWIHGGALIMGHRGGIDGALRDGVLKAGYTLVSIDYRLAPETKLAGIREDIRDAYRWVREKGPGLLNVDTRKIAVMGGSAGGYLTLTAGHLLEPRPTVLVSLWGYGDIAGPWYSRPDPFYRKRALVTKEEARAAVGKRPISEPPTPNERGKFYLYCRQQGLWPLEVTGFDPDKEPRAFDPFCPVRKVTANYPPTLLVHGTKDTDVPYELSESMAKELARHKVEHELITIADGGHGLGGVKPEIVAGTYAKVLAFLDKHMRR